MRKIFFLSFAAALILVKGDTYTVSLTRINNQIPSLNSQKGQSAFTYNYNPSYVPVFDENGILIEDALLVRSQMAIPDTLFGVG